MSDDIEESHDKAMLVYKLSDTDKEEIAKLVVTEFMKAMQIGVGKSILDHIWKVFVGILIAAAIYGLASSNHLHVALK